MQTCLHALLVARGKQVNRDFSANWIENMKVLTLSFNETESRFPVEATCVLLVMPWGEDGSLPPLTEGVGYKDCDELKGGRPQLRLNPEQSLGGKIL